MKKIKYLYLLFLFTIFVPRVYAFTYDFNISVDGDIVSAGTTKDIKISLKDVQGVSGGFGACSLNIELDDTIELTDTIKTSDGWSMMVGNIYAFDTSDSFVNGKEMFTIPVKINNSGSVKITNIKCSDGESNEIIADKTIKFKIKSSQEDGNDDEVEDIESGEVETIVSSNISSITLTEGTINFDPNITEYDVIVSDFNSFDVSIQLESSSSSYTIDKNNNGTEKQVVITVTDMSGEVKTYTLNIIEDKSSSVINNDDNNNSSNSNNYVPIFIVIIVILVLINIFRIIKNRKK